LEIAVQVITIQ